MSVVAFTARDSVARVTPLGVRFRDAADGRAIRTGLVVSHSWAQGTRSRIAVVNGDGVWVLAGLPGLGPLERGDHPALRAAKAQPGDGAYWAAATALGSEFAIDVADPAGRYLPLRLRAQLPHRGLFEPVCGSPLSSPLSAAADAVALFPAPQRPVPAGFGVVRAQLAEPSGAPASWALLQVTPDGGPTSTGMADARGLVVVLVAYPEPSATAGPPPLGGGRPLTSERWDVRVACRYDRSCPPDAPPELCPALGQAPAQLDLATPAGAVAGALPYGHDLVLRTPGRSELLVTPAASPP